MAVVTNSWPYANTDTTDAEYSWLFRILQTDGVIPITGRSDLKVSTGTGLSVKMGNGRAFVHGFIYDSTADDVVLPVTAPDLQGRIDAVVLQLDTSKTTPQDRLKALVVKGTASASPQRPSLVQTDTGLYQYPIAWLNVPAGAATITGITDARVYVSTMIGAWPDDAGRPVVNPLQVYVGWNRTRATMEWWNGAKWDVFPPKVAGKVEIAECTSASDRNTYVASRTAIGQPISVYDPAFVWMGNDVAGKQLTFSTNGSTWSVLATVGVTEYRPSWVVNWIGDFASSIPITLTKDADGMVSVQGQGVTNTAVTLNGQASYIVGLVPSAVRPAKPVMLPMNAWAGSPVCTGAGWMRIWPNGDLEICMGYNSTQAYGYQALSFIPTGVYRAAS